MPLTRYVRRPCSGHILCLWWIAHPLGRIGPHEADAHGGVPYVGLATLPVASTDRRRAPVGWPSHARPADRTVLHHGVSVKLMPGVRLRLSSRGLRTSIGPRIA